MDVFWQVQYNQGKTCVFFIVVSGSNGNQLLQSTFFSGIHHMLTFVYGAHKMGLKSGAVPVELVREAALVVKVSSLMLSSINVNAGQTSKSPTLPSNCSRCMVESDSAGNRITALESTEVEQASRTQFEISCGV